MFYPVFIFKSEQGLYDGYFPDFESCFFAGDTLVEAMENAEAALDQHLAALTAEGLAILPPQDPALHLQDPRLKEDKGWLAMVKIDPARYEAKAVKFNLTMSQNLLAAIDRFIDTHPGYRTRSQFLADLARQKIAR